MTTNNAVNVGLSGSTGTGSFAGSTSPTFVTPTLGAATATSLAFSPTTGGIIGTTAADNVTAGDVGELISSVIASGSAISFSNNTAANITSISLSAGDWDVRGNVSFNTSNGNGSQYAWISLASATLPNASLYSGPAATTSILGSGGVTTPTVRVNVSTTTTVYLSGQCQFGAGTTTCSGGIYARRIR